eukprot:TRINITY_DN7921_c0_g1_i1.p2 TRINITY_DN7921_c0_g1~~TRINITY_DN7921_c0_g1_i1.p2  ORF type:complete len:284 (-),score=83.48 TRINITY_DN7921_c0_g1_i1:307-1158(-)
MSTLAVGVETADVHYGRSDYFMEVVPRIGCAGGIIGLITVKTTVPQVIKTSGGAMGALNMSLWTRMFMRISPKAGGLKAVQYGIMREIKTGLDATGCDPSVSKMLAFGVAGTGFQSVIYNLLIADVYKIYTGKEAQRLSFQTIAKSTMPGIVWCFGRETFSMGAGIALQPFVARYVQGKFKESGVEVPDFALRFTTGFMTGGMTALGTQWMHNLTLVAGRMAAQEVKAGAPHYTSGALTTAWQELGPSLFYMNYPQRMTLIAGAVALLSLCDIFHRPELRLFA